MALPVFPGAEGFGTETPAGRGGVTCIVNSLADSGRGSLRHCLELDEPRTVIFTITGVITVNSTLNINAPFISIFGQTAAGAGVMVRAGTSFRGPLMRIATHDVLMQHMRLRAGGSDDASCCRDALSVSNKEPGNVYNVVIDHSSIQWGTDEVMDVWYDSNNITISNSIIAEGLFRSTNDEGPAGRGIIIGSEGSHSISLHHNLMANNYQRNPLIKSKGVVDVVNNIIFNWVSRAAGVQGEHGDVKANFVNNTFIARSDGPDDQTSDLRWSDISVDPQKKRIELFVSGNASTRKNWFRDKQENLVNAGRRNLLFHNGAKYMVPKRHEAPPITEVGVDELESSLLSHVGASLPARDATDARIVEQVEQRAGRMIDCVSPEDPSFDGCKYHLGGWPTYDKSALPPQDFDKDGIPDDWELLYGLSPDSAADARQLHTSGYSNLEAWVHSLDALAMQNRPANHK